MPRPPLPLLLTLAALTAFGPMSIDLYLPSLPFLEKDLAAAAGSAQFTLAAFVIGLALGQALYGPLVDHYGRKRPLYVGTALYVLASVGCALAPNMESLVALRFVQALGSCAGVVVARAMVRDLFDAQTSARVFSMLMLVMGLAPILAPMLGGQLQLWFGWRANFWVLVLFGLACLLASLTLPETRAPQPKGTPLGLARALASYRALLVDRRYMGFALTIAVCFGGLFAYISGSPFVLIELYEVAPEHFGWVFGGNALGMVIATQINRRLLQSYSSEALLRAGLIATALLGLLLLAATLLDLGLAGLLPPLFLVVASLGFVMPNAAAAAMAACRGELAGSGSALMGTLQFAVATAAGVLLGLLQASSAVPLAAVMAGCCLLALLLHRRLVGTAPAGA